MNTSPLLEQVVTAVLTSPKYRHISPDLVRRIAQRELTIRGNLKATIKATRNKLHQVAGAYIEAPIAYDQAAAQLRETAVSSAAFHATCHTLMRQHTSTRERLPILDTFFRTTLSSLPPIHTVLDVACGLNVLAWPYMPFSPQTHYYPCDIYADLMHFVGQFMTLTGIPGTAELRDVISHPPDQPVDLALLLKVLPVLAQVEKTAVPRLLDTLCARYLLITFPQASLGGHAKGMAQTYEKQFQSWSNGRDWHVTRFAFPTELAFLVQTPLAREIV